MQSNDLLKHLIAERNRLNLAINALLPGTDEAQAVEVDTTVYPKRSSTPIVTVTPTLVPPNGRVKGTMSAAARKAIGDAQKKRWKAFRAVQAKQLHG